MGLDVMLTVQVGGTSWEERTSVFERHTTHNLRDIAIMVGLYYPLWNPYALQDVSNASELVPHLERGLAELKGDKKHYEQFNHKPSHLGNVDMLIEFTEAYLEACKANPDAKVHAYS